jgi:hypothetical protein
MAIHDYPAALVPETIEWASIKSSVQFKSPFNGATESIEFPGERWAVSLGVQPFYARDGGQAEAFWARLAGGMERVRIWHFMRPQPLGSMRGTPTVAVAAVRGDLVLQLNTTGTLKAGDMIGVGSQLCQVFQDCEPSGGVLSVPLVQRIRGAVSAGTSVVWQKPTALFVMPATSSRSSYSMNQLNRATIDLEEVYQ